MKTLKYLSLAAVAAIVVVAMAACNQKKTHHDDEDDEDETELTEDDEDESDEFRVKTVKFEKSGEHAEVGFEFDYPAGNSVVADSVRAFILRIDSYTDNVEGSRYTGSIKNGAEFIKYYGNKAYETLSDSHESDLVMVNEDLEEGQDSIYFAAYGENRDYKLEYDAPRFVTYIVNGYDYMGGAHGMPYSYGATFSKADGKRLGNPLKNTESPEFHKLLIEGVTSYFSENGETGDLRECLLVDPDELGVPGNEPYLTKGGVCFIYGAYEIAPYAYGMPDFTIPYDKIKPFLTSEAKRLIED